MSEPKEPKKAAPYMFCLPMVAYGASGGFQAITMPYLLREAGVSIEEIGWFAAASFLPPVLQFLWAPIVDVGLRRRTWLALVATIGAICLMFALRMPLPSQKGAFLGLVVAGQIFTGLVGSANGGLMATALPDEQRGSVSGWINAGNLGGASIGAALSLRAARTWGNEAAGYVLVAMIALPALSALLIPETREPARVSSGLLGTMRADLYRTARSRPGWTGILLCISPVGTAALMNFFSALAPDYKASAFTVELVNGWLGAILTAVGSLVGGFLCDRIHRRAAYLGAGALTALCGIVLAFMPTTETFYIAGCSVYLFIAGLCYASFNASVLEIVGSAGATASTQYTLFTAAGNFAIMYTGWLDTRFHEKHGARALFFVDAAANLVGIALLATLMLTLARRSKNAAPAQ